MESSKSKKADLYGSHLNNFTLIFILLFLGILIFSLAYFSMTKHILLDKLNQPVLSFMLSNRNDIFVSIAKIITNLASPVAIIIVVAITSSLLITKKDTWRPILLITSVFISSITSLSIKSVVRDARPLQAYMVPSFETNYSFPSGHTLSMAVLLFVIGYIVCSRSYSRKKLFIWIISAASGTTMIAVSRLYLGYHWLTDVCASIGLGLIILAIAILIDKIAARRFNNKLEQLF